MDTKQQISKQHIEAMVQFAVKYIPQIDEDTLSKLVDLIHITGNFNAISQQQLLRKINLMIHLIPGTCQYSLVTLIELLEICVQKPSDCTTLWRANH